MASISISETQFVFTYFHKLASLQRPTWSDFVFPTLGQEGNPNGGFGGADLVISNNLFIQFKVPDILWTYNTNEFKNYHPVRMTSPYFRIHIKNKLLSGKPNSGQYEMLRILSLSGKTALYVFPVFDFSNEQDDPSLPNYWFRNFYLQNSLASLNSYCISVDFADLQGPQFNITNTDKHTICCDYNLSMVNGEVLFFSEPKPVSCSKFIRGFNIADNLLSWPEEIVQKSTKNIIEELKSILKSQEVNGKELESIASIRDMQTYLMSNYDIYWLPIRKSIAQNRHEVITELLQD